MNIVTEDLPLNHHFIGINSTIPFFLIVNNDENTKTYHSPNDYQINVWDMMLKEKFPNSPAWTMQIRYDKDSILDATTLVISSYDVDLANNTAGAKQITVIDGGNINAIQNVNTIDTLNTVNTLDSVNEVKKVLEVDKINNLYKGEFLHQEFIAYNEYKGSIHSFINNFENSNKYNYDGWLTIRSNLNNNNVCLFGFTDKENYSTKKELMINSNNTYHLYGHFIPYNDVGGFRNQLKSNYNYLSNLKNEQFVKFYNVDTHIIYFYIMYDNSDITRNNLMINDGYKY